MSPRARIALALLTLGALIAGVFLFPVKAWLVAFLDWSAGLGVMAPVILGAAYVPAAVLMLPGSVLTLGTGFVAGLGPGFLAVWNGATLGATVAFLLGRTVARPWVEAKVKDSPRFRAVQEAVAQRGLRIVLLLRLSPIFPFNLLNYALGVTGVRLRDYVLGTWLGMIPGALMYVYVGTAAKDLAEVAAGKASGGLATKAFFVFGLLVTIVVTVWITRIARKALSAAVGEAAGDAVRDETLEAEAA
ncbi:MAG: TVP38/TMEM64 family protein [Deltaproteobacteria bacterium]|nr:TVP38/TMEM64 family protein [Deltaproteobacteria bacterium]